MVIGHHQTVSEHHTMKRTQNYLHTLLLAALIGLAGCESNPLQPATATAPKASLQFLDLQGFDQDMTHSLSASLPQVEVAFFDRVTPSAMPERLQQWVASVQQGGGQVTVTPPRSSVTAKNPFLLISAASTIWSASNMARDMATKAQFRAARAYNAEIILKQDDRGETVVDKVVFAQKPK
jgi:hypothetical protein